MSAEATTVYNEKRSRQARPVADRRYAAHKQALEEAHRRPAHSLFTTNAHAEIIDSRHWHIRGTQDLYLAAPDIDLDMAILGGSGVGSLIYRGADPHPIETYATDELAHSIAALRLGNLAWHGGADLIVPLGECYETDELDDLIEELSEQPGAGVAWLETIGEGTSDDPRRQYFDAVSEVETEREKTASKTYTRIAELKTEGAEEGITTNPASEAALRRFLNQHRSAAMPGVALLDNGNLRVMWRRTNGEQVGLQFRGADDIQFVLFKRRGNRLTSYAGRDTFDGMTERLRADGLLDLVTG